MSFHLMPFDGVAATPWRNGGGVTRELLAWPSAQDWRIRISVADVEQDGPFSRFDGVQRWFAVLEGAGVRLTITGREHEVIAGGEPVEFDGAAPTDCALIGGATRDFNLMSQGTAARLCRMAGALESEMKVRTFAAIYAHDTPARVILSADELVQVPPRTLAWRILEPRSPLRIEGNGALWIEAAV